MKNFTVMFSHFMVIESHLKNSDVGILSSSPGDVPPNTYTMLLNGSSIQDEWSLYGGHSPTLALTAPGGALSKAVGRGSSSVRGFFRGEMVCIRAVARFRVVILKLAETEEEDGCDWDEHIIAYDVVETVTNNPRIKHFLLRLPCMVDDPLHQH